MYFSFISLSSQIYYVNADKKILKTKIERIFNINFECVQCIQVRFSNNIQWHVWRELSRLWHYYQFGLPFPCTMWVFNFLTVVFLLLLVVEIGQWDGNIYINRNYVTLILFDVHILFLAVQAKHNNNNSSTLQKTAVKNTATTVKNMLYILNEIRLFV